MFLFSLPRQRGQQLFEGHGIVAGAVGDVVNKDGLRNLPVNADVLPGNDQPVARVTQFFILRDMAGIRVHPKQPQRDRQK